MFQPIEYQERYQFVELELCDYYLENNNLQKLKERIQIVINDPISGIEAITIRLYFQLLYHGLYNDAAEYSKAVYKPIYECEQLWGSPETPLIEGLYFDALQEVYQEYKSSGIFNTNNLIKIAAELDLNEDIEVFETEKRALQNPLNLEYFQDNFNSRKFNAIVFIELSMYFLKYMFDTYQIPFKLSKQFWNLISVKGLFNQSKAHGFFYIDVRTFAEMLEKRIDYHLGSNNIEMFGRLWGLNYIYEFLEKFNLISFEDARLMEENNTYHLHEFIKYTHCDLWQMNFIFKWPQSQRWEEYKPLFNSTYGADLNSAKETINLFLKDKPVPQRILTEISLGNKKLELNSSFQQIPIVNSKTIAGRNDPCPCGSGKKYKKCCQN
jgi:hypothetical protein